jgi:hypothetical protein
MLAMSNSEARSAVSAATMGSATVRNELIQWLLAAAVAATLARVIWSKMIH